MITSVGLIGDPVEHSISPAFQNAAFEHYGLPDRYALWHTSSAGLAARVASLRAKEMRGANVTLPHKTAVVALLDELDEVAEAVGAVNTIVRTANEKLRGLNTDVPGFLNALQMTGFDTNGARCVLLGAGGAARAVAYGLVRSGVQSLTVVNRTLEHAEDVLADVLAVTDLDPELTALPADSADVADVVVNTDLLINATSVGLNGQTLPIAPDLLTSRMLVVDLIYRTTPLLRAAAQRGARTQHGLEMLVQQGALAFEAWTGLPAPLAAMRAAAQQAVKERT